MPDAFTRASGSKPEGSASRWPRDTFHPLTPLRSLGLELDDISFDLLDRVAVRAGFPKGRIRARMLRATYATARLQTLDHGAPVGRWTVEKELGHGSGHMLEAVYGRPGEMQHRSEVPEYRFEQHFERRAEGMIMKAGAEISAPLARTIEVAPVQAVG